EPQPAWRRWSGKHLRCVGGWNGFTMHTERRFTTADFEFELPPQQIAQTPSERRDASRLLVLDRSTGAIEHRVFSDLIGLLLPGDALVLNETRVFPARLRGRRPGGGDAEI